MRHIAIIGAGQAGLLLGIGLVDRGYGVTLISDRTKEEILHGPAPAGSVVFHDALEVERELGLSLWDDVAVMAEAVHIDVGAPGGGLGLSIEARLNHPGLCVDQRVKSARWIEIFARRGGRFVTKPVTVSDLEAIVRDNDLVVVAAGRGEISRLFPRDDARSPFREAPRRIALMILRALPVFANFKTPGVKFRILPGAGEIFSAPMYTEEKGQIGFVGLEAIPGGPMDRFVAGMRPEAQLDLFKELFRELVPWDYDAIRDVALGEERAYVFPPIVPTVRRPWGALPSGAVVMGIADAVNLLDPIAAQGANNAAKMARLYRERIVAHGDRPFDAAWMEGVFEEAWGYLRHGNLLAEKLLQPPAPHAMEIMGAASQNPVVASRLINGFTHPPSLFPWFSDPVEAHRFLASTMAP